MSPLELANKLFLILPEEMESIEELKDSFKPLYEHPELKDSKEFKEAMDDYIELLFLAPELRTSDKSYSIILRLRNSLD